MSKPIHIKPDEFLKLFKISDRRYIIGIYQTGITVYSQQIRTLNIFYALVEAKVLNKNLNKNKSFRIGIIGAGTAGITFASAALLFGYNVTLFDRKPIYLHMQHGCETRLLHPNIYNWPDPNALFPIADLPFLDWKAGTASNVARQIVDSFDKITNKNRKLYNSRLNSNINGIEENKKDILVKFKTKRGFGHNDEENNTEHFDLVIFATGYGIETYNSQIPVNHTPSYWHNDNLSQLDLDEKENKILISGTGDGALIDLFRTLVLNFDLNSVISALKSDKKNYIKLITQLRKIKSEWIATVRIKENDWLYNELDKLYNRRLFSSLVTYLVAGRRNNNKLILNGKFINVESLFDISKISFLNAVIAYCLYKKAAFQYVGGDIKFENHIFQINDNKYHDYKIIIRHGTNRDDMLHALNLSDNEIESLRKEQSYNYAYNNIQLWEPGWWSLNVKVEQDKSDSKYEFFTTDTQCICSIFVSVLNKVLEQYHKKLDKSKKFRVTLHRIIKLNNAYYFQQITPYYGTKKSNIDGSGRIFEITGGVVGLAATSGKSILIVKKDSGAFSQFITDLRLKDIHARMLSNATASILAIPIKGYYNGIASVNLVLYIDSTEDDFFQNDEFGIIFYIRNSINGFVEAIDNSLKSGKIIMGELAYEPYPIDEHVLDSIENNSSFIDSSSFWNRKDQVDLSFDHYHSFDIVIK